MSKNLIAKAATSIGAPTTKVWQALVTPDDIKQYMFGAEVESDWSEGSEITWKGEVKGKKYQDKGIILKLDPEHTLQYSHFSPLSGKPDKPENYHTVTVNLFGTDNKTEIFLSQDNNSDEEARKESEKNWGVMLEGLKNTSKILVDRHLQFIQAKLLRVSTGIGASQQMDRHGYR